MDVIKIEEGEQVIHTIRKHWIMLLRDSIGTAVLGIMPLFLFGIISFSGFFPSVHADGYAAFGVALWILLIWITLAIIWTNYYLDMWILTNRRMFVIEQVGLFDRRVSTWNLERVQQITVRHENILETFLGYGTLTVETAGHSDHDVSVRGIPRPEEVRTHILHQMGTVRQMQSLL
jgi:uncharacterized membrane protein YdbT with pleckstrin-like domain